MVLKVISSHNYRLDTPPGIYNVFYVSLLKRAAADPFLNQRQNNSQPPVIIMDGEEKWEVKRILRRCAKGRQRQVLVKWKGYLTLMWEFTEALVNTEMYYIFEAEG